MDGFEGGMVDETVGLGEVTGGGSTAWLVPPLLMGIPHICNSLEQDNPSCTVKNFSRVASPELKRLEFKTKVNNKKAITITNNVRDTKIPAPIIYSLLFMHKKNSYDQYHIYLP